MSNCKCGKPLLEGEKKCSRCKKKNNENGKKVIGIAGTVATLVTLAWLKISNAKESHGDSENTDE